MLADHDLGSMPGLVSGFGMARGEIVRLRANLKGHGKPKTSHLAPKLPFQRKSPPILEIRHRPILPIGLQIDPDRADHPLAVKPLEDRLVEPQAKKLD